ncbi:hypothetical protein Tco_0749504 [Tanacetum coccineum]|uniref:Uncharacterized protein n=1 Tax=Tanacetum coccineum TaxID=301880 RepID=A0ABQ4YYL5_9ASTR
MMVQATQDEGVDSGIPTDSQQTPITTQPSSSRPQKKLSRRKQRKETKVPQDKTHHDDSVPIPSNVLDLEKAKDTQAKEIAGLKKRVQKLERKKKSRTTGKMHPNRGGIFEDFDKDAEVSLVDETQGRLNDAEMFDTDDFHELPTSIDALTLAQTLIEIKAAKPKAVTTIDTTTTITRPKVKGVVVQEPSEFRTTTSSPQASQPSKTKDKGKAIMIEPEVPLKRKDQVALDEEMARNPEAQLQAELIEEEKIARKKEEEANIALIESWENTQAIMKADRLLAERLQTREQEDLKDEEKSNYLWNSMEKEGENICCIKSHKKREKDLQPRPQKKKDKSSSKKIEIAQDNSAKRAGDKLEFDESKKQKTDENEEVEEDNEAKLRKHLVIVKNDDKSIYAIPVATKPPVIVEYKLIKEGIVGHYQLIRADGSSKRYSSMIRIL